MKIGVVVHGPYIVDSGHAAKILNLLEDYGEVKARLGGTMGRTAVHDASLDEVIDISQKLLPSESIRKFSEEESDVIFLINYGKSSITGHTFGFKVCKRSKCNPPLIQIERPGETNGSVIPWNSSLNEFAEVIASRINLKLIKPEEIVSKIDPNHVSKKRRKVAGVCKGENIFINGLVIGKSTSEDVTLIAEDGIITDIEGGELKEHGVEKLGKIDLECAIIKTGLLRRSEVVPRILKPCRDNSKLCIAFLNHAAEDVYRLKEVDYVVTVGDDTTLVAGDILYRFGVPIIGITDGDVDKVVETGFKSSESLIIELESGLDDIVGKKIHEELFEGKEIIQIENIETFKNKILQIVNNITRKYKIKEN
ncbi:DUF2117 domain-containing protein [Methanobacterium sp. ACI-7]|uniref:DUF2117 domain-containing protein n=1 Tax=unclassified Methanobacterium TaxID=2627676 RepID=UPI0039C48627